MRVNGIVETTFEFPNDSKHFIRLRRLNGTDKTDARAMIAGGAKAREQAAFICDRALVGFCVPGPTADDLVYSGGDTGALLRFERDIDEDLWAFVDAAFLVHNGLMPPDITVLLRAYLVVGYEALPAGLREELSSADGPSSWAVAKAAEIAGDRYLFGVGDLGNSSGSSGTSAAPGDAATSETDTPTQAE